MLSTIAVLKTALAGKTPLLGAVFSGGISLWLAEFFGPGTSVAGTTVIVALSGAAGAFFASLPKIISARSAAANTERQLREGETDKLIGRIHDSYRIDIGAHRHKVRQYQRIAALERKSKHKALSECQRLTFHINLLEQQLRAAALEPPDFHVTAYHDLVGTEDDEIANIISEEAQPKPEPPQR